MIESGWEDEASTTVEQGDVAEKLRALGAAAAAEAAKRSNTSITATNGSAPEELTVDDQRASAAMAMLPPPIAATLVITLGNDQGKSIEVRAGKTYTIGRGMDNDLVLTDIAVSRKHFDIRHDNGAWIVADRGSGNGTLVNNRVEDAPFALATGDVIEIGNTAFRFDMPGGEPRRHASYDGDDDLEVRRASSARGDADTPHAGPPVAPPVAPVASHTPGRIVPAAPSIQHAQTAPLPRPRAPTTRPLVGYALERPGAQSQAMPIASPAAAPQVAVGTSPPPVGLGGAGPASAGTLSSPMASPSAQLAAQSPSQPSTAAPQPALLGNPPSGRAPLSPTALLDSPPAASTATLQGTGAPSPVRVAFSPGPRGESSQPLSVVATRGHGAPHAAIDFTSTARVQPIAYANTPAAPSTSPAPARRALPQLTTRVKLAIAGGFVLVVAIVTVALVASPGTPSAVAPPLTDPPPPIVEPAPALTPARDPALDAPSTAKARSTPPAKPAPVPAKSGAIASGSAASTPAAIPPPATPAPPKPPIPGPARVETPASKPADKPGPALAPAVDKTLPTIARPAIIEKSADKPVERPAEKPAPPSKPELTPPKPDPRKAPAKRIERKPDKPDKKGATRSDLEMDKPDKMEAFAPPAKPDAKRKTPQEAKLEATALYRAKNFSGASAAVSAAVPSATGGSAQELKTLATIYGNFGKDYNLGMSATAKAPEAYAALNRARGYDRDLGGAYGSEIEQRLASVAVRAALAFTAKAEYDSAFQAVRLAESLGVTSATNKSVRDKLVEIATDLVRSAQAEIATNPEDAKKKLRQVLGIVEPKHPLYIKASKLLAAP